MADKIVAISDPHLGQSGTDRLGQYSLLSRRSPNNLVRKFGDAVARFAGSDSVTLVVTGDLLDLALSYMEDALLDLRELLKEVRIDTLLCIGGNHDRKLVSLHCEEKNLLAALRAGRIPSSDPMVPSSKAIYRMRPGVAEPFTVLQPLVDQIYGPDKVPVLLAYPSYMEEIPGGALLYFIHGDLFSGIDTKISELLRDRLATLPHDRVAASVNQPLIELIYWLIGEMGEGMGADGLVEEVYTDLQKGQHGLIRGLVDQLVARVFPDGVVPVIPDRIERRWIAELIMDKLREVLPSPDRVGASTARHAGVEHTRDALWNWIRLVSPLRERVADTSRPTHVIYGHTHVADAFQFPGTTMFSWNLGSWLIEPGEPLPEPGFLGIHGHGMVQWVRVR
ncbi:MAG TPA: metallophosphoesterase [Kofleriaceae bacterium]|nr:metallophosphoesterase [Kofleriaceae bacterium]